MDSTAEGYSERLFLLNKEGNIPILYAELSLGFFAILLTIEYFLELRKSSSRKYNWLGLSIIYTAFVIDELISIHEFLIALRPVFNRSGLLHFARVIPGILFVLVVVGHILEIRILVASQDPQFILLSGVIYVSGVLGFEMIGGYIADNIGGDNVVYPVITTIEETLEMVGIVVFSYALLTHISSQVNLIVSKFDFKQGES